MNIDELAANEPDLFEKYLYVGATCAVTYFGMTCKGMLSAKLGGVSELFCADWT